MITMSARAYLNRVYFLFKVYLSVGLIGAFSAFGVMLIGSEPWIGAILFIVLEGLVVLVFLLRKTGATFELGRVRIEFGAPHLHSERVTRIEPQ
jgi:hypothetical protein